MWSFCQARELCTKLSASLLQLEKLGFELANTCLDTLSGGSHFCRFIFLKSCQSVLIENLFRLRERFPTNMAQM